MQPMTNALSTWTPASSVEPLPAAAMADVFRSLRAQLGAKIADLYNGVPPEDVQAEWAARLSGFRRHELARGIEACSNRRFAPTLGEFKQLCRPALDPELAWLEASAGLRARSLGEKGEWTHPAVFRAASAMAHEVRSRSFKECRGRWDAELTRQFAAGWGEKIPMSAVQITNDTRGGPPSANVRAHIATILAKRPAPAATQGDAP